MPCPLPRRKWQLRPVILCAVSALASAQPIATRTAALPLGFERNVGQAPRWASFLARRGSTSVLISGQTIRLTASAASVDLRFVGSRSHVKGEAVDLLSAQTNYLLGSDPSRWITNVPNYRGVRYRNLYPGIDLVCHGSGEQFEYDFNVSPGADLSSVRLAISAAYRVSIDHNGDLIFENDSHRWRQAKPTVYQGSTAIEGRYVLRSNQEVSIEIPSYDRAKPMVVDPVVSYATYLVGAGRPGYQSPPQTSLAAIALDANGNLYIAGATNSDAFPVTPGAPQRSIVGPVCPERVSSTTVFQNYCFDAFVSKLNATGTALLYSTYIGGNGHDVASAIAVDEQGRAYVAGTTSSSNFPTTPNALQPKAASGAFLLQLDPLGSKLLYSTYLSGAGESRLAITPAGDLWMIGTTSSPDLPLVKPLQARFGSGPCVVPEGFGFTCTDVFVTRWHLSDMSLVYSSYLGGNGEDIPTAIALDPAGNVWIAGSTRSTDFPLSNPFQSVKALGERCLLTCSDAFIAKLSPAGDALLFSTYLGGLGDDSAASIGVDALGNVYVAGTTAAPDFPLVAPFHRTPASCLLGSEVNVGVRCTTAFAVKLSSVGRILYSTLFPAAESAVVTAAVADSAGNFFVSGYGATLPTSDALNHCSGGFLSRLTPTGVPAYSTYLAGWVYPNPGAMTLDSKSGLYIASQTSISQPTTPGASQTWDQTASFQGYIYKIDLSGSPGPEPVIDTRCILNAASFSSTDASFVLTNRVGPGEIVTILGRNLGPASGVALQPDTQGRFPTDALGVSVTFDDIPAPLLYVQANQINAVAPFGITPRRERLEVRVRSQGVLSESVQVGVSKIVGGIFTVDGSGLGQAAALNQDGTMNSPDNPAARGTIVSLWATGFGPAVKSYPDGQIVSGEASRLIDTPKLSLGSLSPFRPLPVTIDYIGQAPGLVAGAVQVNFRIPDDAPTGPAVQIGLEGAFQYVTIAIRQP